MPDPSPKAAGCPICGKAPGGARLSPFCSRRCADVDLGRWFTGSYSVPSVESDEDSTELDPDP